MQDYGNRDSGNREVDDGHYGQPSAGPSGLLRSPAPIVGLALVLCIAVFGLLATGFASESGQTDGQADQRSLAGVSAESAGLAGPALAVTSAVSTSTAPQALNPETLNKTTTIPPTSVTTAPLETATTATTEVTATTAEVTATTAEAPPSTVPQDSESSAKAIPSSNGADDSAVRAAVLQLTNAERAKVDCPALVENRELIEAADGHAEDMAINDYFSHSSQDGRGFSDRVREAGFTGRALGEIIAAGQQTPEGAVGSWMNSDGHRQAIQNCGYRQVGIGYGIRGGTRYWVQVFGG